MSKTISLLILGLNLILLTGTSLAQGVWEVQNPLPTAETMLDGYCLPNTTYVWAVGSFGEIIKTVDGNSWSRANSGTTSTLFGVHFYNTNIGWAVGENGTIIKTINGGSNWFPLASGTAVDLQNVFFYNSNIGWAVGETGTILKTTDGGTSWSTLASGITNTLMDVHFESSSIGWAVGYNGTILKTTDGGTIWVAQSSTVTPHLQSVFFVNTTTGWATGMNSTIVKTVDGGTTWAPQTAAGVSGTLENCFFYSSSIGWICGYGYILKTTNGGTTWNIMSNISTNSNRSVCFANSTNGWVVGSKILKTNDGGTNWVSLTTGITQTINDLEFIDANTGWAVGSYSTSGFIIKTSDGGNTWLTQLSDYSYGIICIDFINTTTGWAVGYNGTILKTTNGGSNWTALSSGTTNSLYGVHFINSSIGWVTGFNGTMLKTTDGGTNWTPQSIGTVNGLSVHFYNSTTGWMSGIGAVMKTTDGGTNWISQPIGTSYFVYKVFFIGSSTGWAAASFGLLKKTTDGGTTWTNMESGTSVNCNDIFFTDLNNGWVIGQDATILRTSNGGTTWTPEICRTGKAGTAVHFIDTKTGWLAGAGGLVMHYTDYAPTSQAYNVTASGITYQGLNLTWTRGNGNQCAVFAKETSSGTCIPDVNVTYLPNTAFGSGDQVGSTGWYCVYNGTGTSVSVTGLQPNTSYTFHVCEYNFDPDFVHYDIATATNNPRTIVTAISPPQITSHPSNRTLCETLSTTFTAAASGSGLSFQWQVNAGQGYLNVSNGEIYSGSQTATLTLIGVPASINANTYRCVVTNISGSATTNDALLTVNPLPVTPGEIDGDEIVCKNSSYIYTVPVIQNATSYNWTFPTGFSGTSTSNNITLTTGSNAVDGVIAVNGVNSCGSGPISTFQVSVKSLPGNASQITGLTSICTGSINIGYSTTMITGADTYTWSLPFGASGSSTINSIMVNYGTNPLTGQITVRGHNMCGDGIQSVLPVIVNTVPSAIGTITGSSNVCKSQKDVAYSINTIPNATSYLWTLPLGATGSNTTNSVSLSFGPDAYSGDLKVSGVNSCGVGAEIAFPVTVDEAPAPAGSISGPSTACKDQTNIVFTVPQSERATSYLWELPDGSTEETLINRISINFDINSVSGNLYVTPLNECGAGNSNSHYIEISEPAIPVISAGDYQPGSCPGSDPIKLAVTQPVESYIYQWFRNGVPMPGETLSYLEGYLEQADYSVEAIQNNCSSRSDVYKIYYQNAPEKPIIYAVGPNVWYLACSNSEAQSYKWYYNNQPVENANKYYYMANQNLGVYSVSISNEQGCYTMSDPVTIPTSSTGVDDTDIFTGLKIYPNPTTGRFTLEMNSQINGEFIITILSTEGKTIIIDEFDKTTEYFSTQIDLSGKPKGMYLISLKLDKYLKVSKIITE